MSDGDAIPPGRDPSAAAPDAGRMPAPAPPPARPPVAAAGLSVCLLFSGAAGLIYETVWTRQLAYSFSSTAVTSCLVLTSFMGGMAIGSWIAGRVAAKVYAPLKLYGYLEMLLALCGGTYPMAIDRVGQIYLSIARGATPGPGLFALRFGMFAALLAVPAVLMGATLPLVVRLVARRREHAGIGLGLLYALNSAGGVVGCLLAGFYLIEEAGLALTSNIGALANLAAALGALIVGTLMDQGEAEATAAEPVREGPPPPPAGRGLALVLAVSGFTAMAYEVLWARTLPLVLGSSTYSFALMLATFVTGVTLGSFAYHRAGPRLGEPRRVVAGAQVAIGAWVLGTMPFYGLLPWPFVFVRTALDSSFATYQALALAINSVVMFVPAFLFGLGFPAAVQARASDEAVGRAVGDLYAANTAGNVAGSLASGLWLIPALGTPVTFQLCGLANALSGGMLAPDLFRGWSGRARVALALVALAAIVPPAARSWMEPLAMGGFSRMRTMDWADAKRRLQSQSRQAVVFREEDDCGTVVVSEQHGERSLWVNGKVDASNTGDMGTQLLLSFLPVSLSPHPRRVFVLGLGSGVTAGAALLDPRVEQVDVCEISKGVLDASRFFASVNFEWSKDPRCRPHVDDGRHFLATSDTRFDVITMEPSNPWMAGITGLYTREFLELCQAHLAEDGVMMQWTHLYEIDGASVRLILRTFQEAFPHLLVFRSRWDLLLVGARKPELLETKRVAAELVRHAAEPKIAPALAAQGFDTPFTLLMSEVFDAASLRRWTGNGPVLTDDHPDLEFSAPVAYYSGSYTKPPTEQLPLSGSLVQTWLAGRPPTVAELTSWMKLRLRERAVIGVPRALELEKVWSPALQHMAAKCFLMQTQPDAALPLARAASDAQPADLEMARTYYQAARSVDDQEAPLLAPRAWAESRRALERLAQLDGANPHLHLDGAELGVRARDPGMAWHELELVTESVRAGKPGTEGMAPGTALFWVAVAHQLADAGQTGRARAAAQQALALDPASADARNLLGELEAAN